MATTTRPRLGWREYSLLHWLLATAALVFAAIWFLSTVVSGFSCPDWIPPTSVLCAVLAAFVW